MKSYKINFGEQILNCGEKNLLLVSLDVGNSFQKVAFSLLAEREDGTLSHVQNTSKCFVYPSVYADVSTFIGSSSEVFTLNVGSKKRIFGESALAYNFIPHSYEERYLNSKVTGQFLQYALWEVKRALREKWNVITNVAFVTFLPPGILANKDNASVVKRIMGECHRIIRETFGGAEIASAVFRDGRVRPAMMIIPEGVSAAKFMLGYESSVLRNEQIDRNEPIYVIDIGSVSIDRLAMTMAVGEIESTVVSMYDIGMNKLAEVFASLCSLEAMEAKFRNPHMVLQELVSGNCEDNESLVSAARQAAHVYVREYLENIVFRPNNYFKSHKYIMLLGGGADFLVKFAYGELVNIVGENRLLFTEGGIIANAVGGLLHLQNSIVWES